MRPEPKIAAFLDLFDRAEQEELTYHTLTAGTVEELRTAFRRGTLPGVGHVRGGLEVGGRSFSRL